MAARKQKQQDERPTLAHLSVRGPAINLTI
jgi:hypothetical protein